MHTDQPTSEGGHAHAAIAGFGVKSLFGWASYDVELTSKTHASNIAPLLILYGDNGSGKTTLLRLLYHLLSTSERRAHKTYIAGIPFRRFTVQLSTGTEISAFRDGDELIGSFVIEVDHKGGETHRFSFVADEELKVKTDKNIAAFHGLRDSLAPYAVSVRMLQDDRRTLGKGGGQIRQLDPALFSSRAVRNAVRHGDGESIDALTLAIARLETWLREKVITSSTAGESNINEIYADVVRRITTAPIGEEEVEVRDSPEILKRLSDLGARNEEFVKYGLSAPLSVSRLIDLVGNSPGETRTIVEGVLDPYVSGVEARLNALEEVREVIDQIVDSLDSFYGNKTVKYHLRSGLRLTAHDGQELAPSSLSSGEQQLLLLLSHTIIARERRTAIIIDEPEISLNVKWQRKLISTLLDLVEGTSVQFIIATHSVELITNHSESVYRLSPNAKS